MYIVEIAKSPLSHLASEKPEKNCLARNNFGFENLTIFHAVAHVDGFNWVAFMAGAPSAVYITNCETPESIWRISRAESAVSEFVFFPFSYQVLFA